MEYAGRGSTGPVDNLMVGLWITFITQRTVKVETYLPQIGTATFAQQYQVISITIRNLGKQVSTNPGANEVINTCG
jgi:hypothetical protein